MSNDQIFSEKYKNLNFSNANEYINLPRYRWYSYKEGFSPRLVAEAINSVNLSHTDYILDPFNGNGTVTLTASTKNINSVGIDVNPFVSFLSRVKLNNFDNFTNDTNRLLSSIKVTKSGLLNYSTFSEKSDKSKWLFNSSVLNTFESFWQSTNQFSIESQELMRLSLIGAAMDNCNATKDGKCLKYRTNWHQKKFDKNSFINSLENRLQIIINDLKSSQIHKKATIINGDSRNVIKSLSSNFKLCITSPPYLNSFDYTDIYRPELFLGKFILNNDELQHLRNRTIRSHVEIHLPKPLTNVFGEIYHTVYGRINNYKYFWDKQIPIMIQSYFEDMQNVIQNLLVKSQKGAQLWLVVANSIYAETEIPVDLILAEIGTRNGWKLLRIEVLRNIQRRKTKYNGNIKTLRESLLVFENN